MRLNSVAPTVTPLPGQFMTFTESKQSPCESLQKLGNKPVTQYNAQQNAMADLYYSKGIYEVMSQYNMTHSQAWNLILPVTKERNKMDIWEVNFKRLSEECTKSERTISSGSGTISKLLARSNTPAVMESSINNFDSLIDRKEFLIPVGIILVVVIGSLLSKSSD